MSEQSQIRRIEVGGSRWSIDPLCVHSRTPPRNEQNVRLDMTLPKIVFQKKTLPWERTVDSSNEDAPMGLLLLREDELEDGYCEILGCNIAGYSWINFRSIDSGSSITHY